MENKEDLLVKIENIVGTFYKVTNRKTNRLVIYAKGAPTIPDDGDLSSADIILSNNADIFVPDYIGYARTGGRFTPKNCIKTLLILYDAFLRGTTAESYYTKTKERFQYTDIHFIGSSFGGAYVPLLPRFNASITNVCLVFPMLNWANIGKSKVTEETAKDVYQAMNEFGYSYLYRGINNKVWKKHFAGNDDLNPVDNLTYLQHARVFIGHGKNDVCIYYKNSEMYYKKLTDMFPQHKKQYTLKLYPHDHSSKTSELAIADYFKLYK